ncbi:hypothetical protein [Solibacillus isronensis]|uniref:hypothetical protein n=1 Tax=Solibacillus isronensis TaxID=412383 RepID=UPI0009A6F89F|nr:hypothetical protein [Solibacillus isronensis]
MTTNYQLMLDFIDGKHTLWQVTKKTDVTCRQLADRHYSRQTVGATSFCRPGKNYVLRTAAGDAVLLVGTLNFVTIAFQRLNAPYFVMKVSI